MKTYPDFTRYTVQSHYERPRRPFLAKNFPMHGEGTFDVHVAAQKVRDEQANGATGFKILGYSSTCKPQEIPVEDLFDLSEPQFAELRADERRSTVEINRRKQAAQLEELRHRRLVAVDLDTTGELLDPLKAANPLFAFRF